MSRHTKFDLIDGIGLNLAIPLGVSGYISVCSYNGQSFGLA